MRLLERSWKGTVANDCEPVIVGLGGIALISVFPGMTSTGGEASVRLAMQKVVGSNPIIRSLASLAGGLRHGRGVSVR
jgi:hypothetical protein